MYKHLNKFIPQEFAHLIVTTRTDPIDKDDKYHGTIEIMGVVLLRASADSLHNLLDQMNQMAQDKMKG